MLREVYEQASKKFLRIKEKAKNAWKKHPRMYKAISIFLFLIYTVFAIFFSGQPFSRPLGNDWIGYAPSAKFVLNDISGWGEISAAAKKAAAFEILKDAVQKWTGVIDTRRMPSRAAAKFQEYAAAFGRQPYGLKFNDGACSGENCIRWQYYQKQWGYSLDLGFAGGLLIAFFPAKYTIAYIQESKTPYKAVRSPITSFITGTIAIVAYAFSGLLKLLVFIFGIGVVVFVLYWAYRLYKKYFPVKVRDGPEPPLTDNYGTASYAPMEQFPRTPDCTAHGVFLGKSSEPARKDEGLEGPGAPIVTTEEHHTLIVARTRTGKGTRVIVPTLLRYEGNMFVIDPKGENAAITARTRRGSIKQTINIINPWGVLSNVYASYGFTPATYNPLDILYRNDPNAVATARRLAEEICPVTGRGNDLFWQQSAAAILAAVFLWLTDQPGEKKTLARVREIVTLSRKKITDQFFHKMEVSRAFDGAMGEMIRNFIGLADTTYTGIIANLTLTTNFISDPQLKRATNVSTFNMADLRDKPTTLYLVIPPAQIETQKTWLRLLIASMTHSFQQPISSTRPRRCMMLIDEFPALGKLQDFPTEIATMAGYGLDYTLVIQGIDQLKSVYDKDSGAILSNCAYKWYCNVTDLEGAKHLSDSLGEATVRTVGKSKSTGFSGAGETSGDSTTWGEKGRKLLMPDEIINLGRDVAIAFQPNGLPMYLKPIDYWNLRNAFPPSLVQDHRGFFHWEPSPSYDPNPYFNKSQKGQNSEGKRAETYSQSQGFKPPPGGGEQKNARGGEARSNPGNATGGSKSGSTAGNKKQSGPKPPPGNGSGSASSQSRSEKKTPPGGHRTGSAKQEQQQKPPPPRRPAKLSIAEARDVLGVGASATKAEIQVAYKRLMKKVHPDHEGSTWIAQKLNEAKVVLLGR